MIKTNAGVLLLTDDEVITNIINSLKDMDMDSVARIAEEMFGGKCFPVYTTGEDYDYEFYPGEDYDGSFGNPE